MQTIQELEQQLAEAKKQAQQSENDKKLEEARQWIGKCYSSHLFQRVPKPGKQIHIRKIEDVKIDPDGRLLYCYYQLEFINWYDGKFKVEMHRSGSHDPYPSWISSWNHEITPDLFDRLETQIKAHAETYFDTISNLFKQSDYITVGDSIDESNEFNLLQKAHCEFIDLPEDVLQILSWKNHPFIYEGALLKNETSITLVKIIADEMIRNANSWGGSIYNRDKPRYDLLMNFYKKYS
jgi:hypothetical protein